MLVFAFISGVRLYFLLRLVLFSREYIELSRLSIRFFELTMIGHIMLCPCCFFVKVAFWGDVTLFVLPVEVASVYSRTTLCQHFACTSIQGHPCVTYFISAVCTDKTKAAAQHPKA